MIKQLPFKIRSVKPEIIQVDKNTVVPNGVREGRWGEEAVTYKGKIYLFRKSVPKYTIEHEKAHVAIKREDNPTLTGVTAELDDEVKADLYTYQKMGKPQSISAHLHSRAGDAMATHMIFDKEKRYNYYQQISHMLYHIKKVYKKYWEYMPEQWKKDYDDFANKVEKSLAKQRVECANRNPSNDYAMGRLKSGGYDIKRVDKRKIKQARLVMAK